MIEFKNVSKAYDSETHALNDVSVAIEKGEFAFIVGASGAGKSTFLKLIMHEETPSKGTIIVNGTNVTELKRRQIPYLRRNMGIVFQDFRLIDKMTVFDNVAFAMRAIGANPSAVKKRVPYILNLVGLSHKLKNRPSELSGGEQQRVSLARALVNNPAIIIADEPTGNIDPEMSYEIIELLSKINDQAGTTVLVVTHEHELVKQFNKRVIEIEKGRVVNDTKEAPPIFEEFSVTEDKDTEEVISEDIEEIPEPEEIAVESFTEEQSETAEENTSEEFEEAEEAEIQEEPAEEIEENAVQETVEEPEIKNETIEDILASLSKTSADVDDASVDEVLAEFRGQTDPKGGED
ncbi:MAG: cell division ATP-binding protein FtsE [Ruminococcus sp.]|nr:cell division ATP-binding protein FtsE [Ruminococcus sp.]